MVKIDQNTPNFQHRVTAKYWLAIRKKAQKEIWQKRSSYCCYIHALIPIQFQISFVQKSVRKTNTNPCPSRNSTIRTVSQRRDTQLLSKICHICGREFATCSREFFESETIREMTSDDCTILRRHGREWHTQISIHAWVRGEGVQLSRSSNNRGLGCAHPSGVR